MKKVVFVACTNVGRAMIEAIYNIETLKDIKISGVVNLHPSAAIGKANYDSYIDIFTKYNIRYYYCQNINEPNCIRFLKLCEPDIIIQSGWSQKFEEDVLNIPRYVCIGEHPAPLPKGRGAACVNWAIINGEHEWGDSFFKMEMEYDKGIIYSQEFFNIELYDDIKTVYDKVAEASVKTIVKYLPKWVEGILEGKEQDESASSYYSRRIPSDGFFTFRHGTALSIYNFIRAQSKPYPGAFFEYKKDGKRKKIYVWKSVLSDHANAGETLVPCKDGKTIVLQRVQEDGQTEMWAQDYFGVSYLQL